MTAFATTYVGEPDIPAGLTIWEYRRSRPLRRFRAMPSNFDWIFKRDPYAAERERASGHASQPRGFGQFGLPRDAEGRVILSSDAPAERLVTPAHMVDP